MRGRDVWGRDVWRRDVVGSCISRAAVLSSTGTIWTAVWIVRWAVIVRILIVAASTPSVITPTTARIEVVTSIASLTATIIALRLIGSIVYGT